MGEKGALYSYEFNPPRLLGSTIERSRIERDLATLLDRASKVLPYIRSIQLTDSVLGMPRLSSIGTALWLRDRLGSREVGFRCNVRTGDRNTNALLQLVGEAMMHGIKGLLFIRGDKPQYGMLKGPSPSRFLALLRGMGLGGEVKLYLGIGAKPEPRLLEKKIASEPNGFVTGPINDLEDLEKLSKEVLGRGLELISTLLVPSPKNLRSASALGLDWRNYEGDPLGFLRSIEGMSTEVLITSPNSFEEGLELLKRAAGP